MYTYFHQLIWKFPMTQFTSTMEVSMEVREHFHGSRPKSKIVRRARITALNILIWTNVRRCPMRTQLSYQRIIWDYICPVFDAPSFLRQVMNTSVAREIYIAAVLGFLRRLSTSMSIVPQAKFLFPRLDMLFQFSTLFCLICCCAHPKMPILFNGMVYFRHIHYIYMI